MSKATPLVSVVVVSYHAADTVIQTLDSIYAQTYSNIELIISDDCSTDDTVAVAQAWATNHADRFINCIIHVNEQNLGVPGNMNTGIGLSGGYYVKVLAADDLLLPDCIEKMTAYCEEKALNNLSARVIPFCIRNGEKISLKPIPLDESFFEKSPQAQYVDLLVDNRIFSPTFFVTRQFFDEMGGYDLRYRLMEDYPMFLKIARQGHQLHFLDDYVVEYRLSDTSLSNQTECRIVHPGFHKTVKKFFFRVRLWGLLRHGKLKRVLGQTRKYLLNDLILLFGNDRNHKIAAFLEKLRDRAFLRNK